MRGDHAYITALDHHAVAALTTPQLEHLKKEGESGRRKISHTRATVPCFPTVQAVAITPSLAQLASIRISVFTSPPSFLW